MTSFFAVLCIAYITVSYTYNLSGIPDHVLSHKVFGSLSIRDKIQSVSLLNKASHHHVRLYHQDEIKQYKELLREIRMLDDIDSLDKIQNITEQLQFSEIWPLMLPYTLRQISKNLQYEIELILDAMNLHPMNISEFKQMESVRESNSTDLDMLILASRALVHYYIIGMLECLSIIHC